MISAGAACYRHGTHPSIGTGQSWTAEELDAAIRGQVSALVFDDPGKKAIEELLTGVVETDFEREQLTQALDPPNVIEDWRVGEAIAEAYLTEHRDCVFPWSDGRDERKSGSSLPGADLVGIHQDEQGEQLVFGEVKTSKEAKYPPGAVHGRTGLKQQMEDLRDQVAIRNDLFLYLGHRARNAPWRKSFVNASKRYLNNPSDIYWF